MSRCIDADALEELFREVIGGIAKKPEMNGNLEHMVRASAMVIEMIQDAPTIEPRCETCEAFNKTRLLIPQPERKKGKWIPVTRIEKWHKEDGLVGFPPEVKEFPQCTIEWVDATEPDEVDGLRCSECGTVYDFTEARNWCSECGADMRTQVETARDIVHEAIDNSVWSDTVDAAEMHKVVDNKYAEIRGDTNVDANT